MTTSTEASRGHESIEGVPPAKKSSFISIAGMGVVVTVLLGLCRSGREQEAHTAQVHEYLSYDRDPFLYATAESRTAMRAIIHSRLSGRTADLGYQLIALNTDLNHCLQDYDAAVDRTIRNVGTYSAFTQRFGQVDEDDNVTFPASSGLDGINAYTFHPPERALRTTDINRGPQAYTLDQSHLNMGVIVAKIERAIQRHHIDIERCRTRITLVNQLVTH